MASGRRAILPIRVFMRVHPAPRLRRQRIGDRHRIHDLDICGMHSLLPHATHCFAPWHRGLADHPDTFARRPFQAMSWFQLDPQTIAARVHSAGGAVSIPTVAASVLRGIAGFTLVSIAGFAPWAVWGRVLYRAIG